MVDIILTIVLLLAVYSGYRRGFIVSFLTCVGLFAGFFIATLLAPPLVGALPFEYNVKKILHFPVLVGLLIGVMVVVRMVANILKRLGQKLMMGMLDSLLGSVFSLFLAILVLSTAFWFLEQFEFSRELFGKSLIYGKLEPFAPSIFFEIREMMKVGQPSYLV